MADYGAIAGGLQGLVGKPLETMNTLQLYKVQKQLEEQEYMKNLSRSMQMMKYFNSGDFGSLPQFNLQSGQILDEAGTPKGEYLPGTESYLQTPPKVDAYKDTGKPKYRLKPSIGDKGRIKYGFEKNTPDKYSKEAKDYELDLYKQKLKLKSEQQDDYGFGDEYGLDDLNESNDLDLRQRAISELQDAGYPISEKNIKEIMRQLGG